MRARHLAFLTFWLLAGCTRLAIPLAVAPSGPATITLVADGERRTLTTNAATVSQALAEVQIHLGELDQVDPAENLPLEEGMVITVVRVIEQFVTAESVVPFQQQLVRNEGLPEGDRRLLQAGREGSELAVYRIEYRDGVEVDRRMVRRQILDSALPEIVMVGVKGTVTPVSILGTLAYISGGNAVIMRGSTAYRDAIVTSGDLDGRVFSLSPDGGFLLCTRSVPASGPATNMVAPFNSLWLVSTTRATGPVRTISTGVENVLWADWSPEGGEIAYSTAVPIPQPPGWEANNDLWLARWDQRSGFRAEQLLEVSSGGLYGWWGARYAWSPNGRYVAYGRADQVGILDTWTGELSVLGRHDVYHTYSEWVWTPTPAWSPDSQFVAAVVHGPPVGGEAPEDSPAFDLWVWGMSGQVSVPLMERVGMWGMPSWSPARPMGSEQASQVAFLQANEPLESSVSRYVLWIIDRDGSDGRALFPAAGEIGLRPQPVAWSPQADQIALVYGGDLYLVGTGPGDQRGRPLTSDGVNSNPVWVSGELPSEPILAPVREPGEIPRD